MTTIGPLSSPQGTFEQFSEGCSDRFPCLSDLEKRSSWGLMAAVVLLHVTFVGVFFLLDADDLVRKCREEPWYIAIYVVLLVSSLVQYFFTSCSSPGYVIDAMRAWNETDTTFMSSSMILKQSASRNGSLISSTGWNCPERSNSQMNSSSWSKLVMDLYPPGSSTRSWTCTYCNIIKPPRSKHCSHCDKCVLRHDHHCALLGTCIGQGNHCRYWWYLFEETILCIWTGILYVIFLGSKTIKAWWKDFIVIILLAALLFCLFFLLLLLLFHSYLALTNQTTYELTGRRRILYLRGIPDGVHPFSRGICRNLYTFCCSRDSRYSIEPLPTMEDLQYQASPYTRPDIVSCQCC